MCVEVCVEGYLWEGVCVCVEGCVEHLSKYHMHPRQAVMAPEVWRRVCEECSQGFSLTLALKYLAQIRPWQPETVTTGC